MSQDVCTIEIRALINNLILLILAIEINEYDEMKENEM